MARVLFVQKLQLMQKENIGIMQLSAVLKAHGHRCEVLLVDRVGAQTVEEIRRRDPDIIGFSVMAIDAQWVREAAALLADSNLRALLVAGGPHPTFCPGYLRETALDAVNVGEGEGSLLELADALDRGEEITCIRNLHVKRGRTIHENPLRPLVDVEQLPLPDRELYLEHDIFRRQGNYNFVVSRGCPYACSFCFIHQWNELYAPARRGRPAQAHRLRPVERCIEEIKDLAREVDISIVTFVDSTFNLDRRWTIDFLEAYGREVGIPFTVNIRPNLVDEEVARAIARTGCCHSVRMGIETGSERLRREVLNKKISDEQIYATAALLKRHGIRLIVFTMYGLPGETLEDALATVELTRRVAPYSFSAQLFHPYPGLEITRYAIERGFLRPEDVALLERKQHKISRSVLRQPEIDEVINTLKLAFVAVRFPKLMPVIRRLVQAPQNPFFDGIYMATAYAALRKYTVASARAR